MRQFNQMLISSLVLMITMLLASTHSYAQFAGDVFFDEPSVAVDQGETRELSLSVFSGASVFGGAQIRLTYDPSELEIVDIKVGNTEEIQDFFRFQESPGEIEFMTLNTKSLEVPFGTINLAKITVRAIAPPGTVALVNSSIESMLKGDSSQFSNSSGFSSEVVITAPPSMSRSTTQLVSRNTTPSPELSATGDDPQLKERALALRPEGSTVTLKVYDGTRESEVVVKTGNGESLEE